MSRPQCNLHTVQSTTATHNNAQIHRHTHTDTHRHTHAVLNTHAYYTQYNPLLPALTRRREILLGRLAMVGMFFACFWEVGFDLFAMMAQTQTEQCICLERPDLNVDHFSAMDSSCS